MSSCGEREGSVMNERAHIEFEGGWFVWVGFMQVNEFLGLFLRGGFSTGELLGLFLIGGFLIGGLLGFGNIFSFRRGLLWRCVGAELSCVSLPAVCSPLQVVGCFHGFCWILGLGLSLTVLAECCFFES